MSQEQTVYIVDDDADVRESFTILMETVGQPFKEYDSAQAFLSDYHEDMRGCLVLDIRMPRMSVLDLQNKLNEGITAADNLHYRSRRYHFGS